MSLRIFGGLSYLSAEEFNRGLAGSLDVWNHIAGLEGLSGGAHFGGAHWGPQAGADLFIPLDSRLSLGIGAALISVSARFRSIFPPNDVVPSSHELKARPWARLLGASLAYLLPLNDSLKIRFQAGAAYYLARAEMEYERDWGEYWEKDSYDLKSKGPGYQAGIGLEYRLNRWAAIYIGGQYRYARMPNFSGSLETTSSEEGRIDREGDLYLFDYRLADDAVFTLIDVLDLEPSGPAFFNVKKAVVDFSGFSLNLGLTLMF